MEQQHQRSLGLTDLEKLVGDALRMVREGDLLALAASPLAQVPLLASWYVGAEPRGSTERGRALQALLEWLIERLRPVGEHSWTQLSWRAYNVLRGFYCEGRRIAELAELLAVAEQTVYPIRAQALTSLARLLQEELTSPADERPNYALQALYPSLPSPQQTLLRLLALTSTPLPVHLVYDLARAVDLPDVELHLQALISSGMLQTNPSRSEFALQPKLIPYLRTLLPPQERRTWHAIIASDALAQARYLAAASHLRAAGDYTAAAEVIIAQHQAIIDNFQGLELRDLLASFRAAEINAPHLWPRLKLVSGDVAMTMDDVPTALAEYQQALAAESLLIKAEAYYKRGRAFRSQHTGEAEAHFAYSIKLLEQHAPTDPLLYRVYLDQAWMLFQDRQDWAKAEASLQRAEALIDPTDRAAWAELTNAWGMFRSHQGDFSGALEYHREAWLAANETQDALLMTHMAHNVGNDYVALRQYDQALLYLRQSAELAQENGNRRMEGLCQKSLGACFFWLGLYERAIEHYARAHAIFTAMQNRNWLANTCYDLAEAYAELGQVEQMRAYFDQAVALAHAGRLERLLNDLSTLAHAYPGLYPPAANLNERQQQVFDYLKDHPSITNRDYRDLTNISPKQAARDLNDLVERQILVRIGEGRATSYRLASGSDA